MSKIKTSLHCCGKVDDETAGSDIIGLGEAITLVSSKRNIRCSMDKSVRCKCCTNDSIDSILIGFANFLISSFNNVVFTIIPGMFFNRNSHRT